jgi:crotonobetainyl-CoA:carnitine CoA-transferase CaiB-like acyl-CoA transferase
MAIVGLTREGAGELSQAGSVLRRSAAPFRVVELASPATAACGRLLAEAGCDVVKVEPPGGAPERRWPPLIGPASAAQSAFSLYHDTGKRAATLDLEAAEGRERLLALAEDADVLLEGLAPGTLAAWGLGYEALAARNAGLVLVSLTAFGLDGPYSQYAANDLTVFAMGGLMFISGQPGEPPVVAPDQQAWTVAGTHGALAALAVLWDRESTGLGDWVDVSAFECLAAQENTLTNYRGPGEFTRRNGSQHRSALPGCILPCRDGYLHLFINQSPPMWERFVAWVGHPPELADSALANVSVRWEHEPVVMEVTRRFVAARTVEELYTSAQAHHLPCVPVYSPAEFLADPQTVAREIVVEVALPELGRVRTLRPPLALGAAHPGVGTAHPTAESWAEQDAAPPAALVVSRAASQFLGERHGGAERSGREPGAVGGDGSRPGSGAMAGGAGTGARGPLSGVRVCAFTHVAAGPYATLQLAYLGAEVIKIESGTRIDSWRYRDRNNDPERSRPFADHNKNVRSVLLDLKTAEGVELARRLIATCDATIDNMSVGVLDRLGLRFEDLRRVRPDIIVLHMAGLGATGPRHEYVTFGPSVMSLCGMTYLWNLPEWPVPVGSQSSYPDYLVGVYAAYAIAAALHRRARTGEALLLDLAQVEAMACALGPSFVATLNGAEAAVRPVGNSPPQPPNAGGSRPPRPPNSGGSMGVGRAGWGWAPYGCYPCRSEAAGCTDDDAWCAIVVETDAQWAGLRAAMGCPAWAEDAALARASGRIARGAWLDERVAEWTRQRTPRDVMERCQAQGVPAGMVATGEDLAHDPHLAARGFLLDMEHPRMGRLPMPGCPIRFARQPVEVWRYGPRLGEDNEYVLREIVGLSADELAGYVERKVVR